MDLIVPKPVISLLYRGQDVGAAIEPYLISLNYIDNSHGEADEVSVRLEDSQGFFSGDFFPRKGDVLNLAIGYDSGDLQGYYGCGEFNIDEAEVEGPPSTVTIKALSTSVLDPIRQKNSRAFEFQTLKQMAQQIADAHGYELRGSIQDIKFQRVTQYQETDLSFLARLGSTFGASVALKGRILIVQETKKLLDVSSQILIDMRDPGTVIRYNLRSKTADSPRQAVHRFTEPAAKKMLGQHVDDQIRLKVEAPPIPGTKPTFGLFVLSKDDVLKTMGRVEDLAQADARASAALLKARMGQVEGTVTVVGDPRVRAGMNVYLDHLGALTANYFVNRVNHSNSRSQGYTTEMDVSLNPTNKSKPDIKKSKVKSVKK